MYDGTLWTLQSVCRSRPHFFRVEVSRSSWAIWLYWPLGYMIISNSCWARHFSLLRFFCTSIANSYLSSDCWWYDFGQCSVDLTVPVIIMIILPRWASHLLSLLVRCWAKMKCSTLRRNILVPDQLFSELMQSLLMTCQQVSWASCLSLPACVEA